MTRVTVPAGVLLMLLLAAPAQAVTILTLSGSGSVCIRNASGQCATTYTGSFTGVVTREIVGPPGGADSGGDGVTDAWDYNGWVHSTYQFTWDTGSFTYQDLPSPDTTIDYARVVDGSSDMLYTVSQSYRVEPTASGADYAQTHATLLSYGSPSWLTGLGFPEGAGLGDIASYSSFEIVTYSYLNSTGTNGNYAGIYGSINWTSGRVTTTSVPEPGTLMLLGLGLMGVFAARRGKQRWGDLPGH